VRPGPNRQAPGGLAWGRSSPKEDTMSTEAAATMQDLELESAELLPGRETLWCYSLPLCRPCPPPPCHLILAPPCY
jgi:hypothetical protein